MSEETILSKNQFIFVICATVIIAFGGLILLLLGFNIAINEFFFNMDTVKTIFSIITYLGDTLVYIVVIAIIWFAYDKRFGKNLAIAVLGTGYMNNFLKDVFQDPRPWTNIDSDLQPIEDSYGFPSGHSQSSVVFYGYVAYESRKNKILPWICMGIIFLVAFSRMVIGVHDLQDVWGGLLFGIVYIVLFIYFEPVVSERINKLNIAVKLLLAILIPIILFVIVIFLFPSTVNNYGLYSGAMIGLSVGYIIECEKIGYNPREIGTKWKIINVIIGLAITLAVYFLLDLIPLEFLIWEFFKYLVLALILVTFVPWIFTKINRKL